MESGLIELLGDFLLSVFDWLLPRNLLVRVLAGLAMLALIVALIWLVVQ